MWSHDKKQKRLRHEKGQTDLLSALTQSAVQAFSQASEEYMCWVKKHSSEHFHRNIHGQEFCMHNLEVMPHPSMNVEELSLKTTGEIDPNGMIVPAASNEQEYPIVEIEIKMKAKEKTQALHKMGSEINKMNLNKVGENNAENIE